jgi:hypothetical protein
MPPEFEWITTTRATPIRSNADRKRAIVEGFRALKPGGRIVIADIGAAANYEEALRALGASNGERAGWGGDSGGATVRRHDPPHRFKSAGLKAARPIVFD